MTRTEPQTDGDSEHSESIAKRVGRGGQYGDPEDHRPAHVAPPDED
ncbi:hypothetical protein HLRTI_002908 [Halorhabdus tiamatea SARL4B]|uniref:Uncharacterized protein n=1 Tax=Halorhabdus tiamatea SARL4B TaxID=1033806 RepID=U2F9C9_9EURY|nr:hypothetical protein [Halorhabdus tiamatea]ERJ05109.1 hypothetical protein HLRTI_002908 [Halorhabdus tiamatea SARL4B]